MQKYRVFFGPNDPLGRDMPSDAERRWLVDPTNPDCPLNEFIGNERAIKKIRAIVYDALGRSDHRCNQLSLALFGPASTGKTTLAKLIAKTVQLPLLEVSPKSVKTVDDFSEKIAVTLEKAGLPLFIADNAAMLPPMVAFIDEVHALPSPIVEGLLKATEHDDGLLEISNLKIDCRNACWIIATTDEGKLFDAFRTRFSVVQLRYLTQKQVASIIHRKNPAIPLEVCELAAFYGGRVTRKALEFARHLVLAHNLKPGDWKETALEVAKDEGIHRTGLSESQVAVLRVLKNGPCATARLPVVTGLRREELERYILPELLMNLADRSAFIHVTRSGYDLTECGLDFVDDEKI